MCLKIGYKWGIPWKSPILIGPKVILLGIPWYSMIFTFSDKPSSPLLPLFFTFFSSALWCFVSEKSLQESQDSMIPWPTSLVPRWVAGQVRDERAPLKTCERLLDTLCLKTACVCVRFFLPPHLCCYVNIYIYIHICFFNEHDITFVAWVSLF